MRAADYAFFDVPFRGLRASWRCDVSAQSASREQPARVPRGGRSRLPLPGDRRSRHPRRGVAGVPRRRARPGNRPDRRNCRAELRPGRPRPGSTESTRSRDSSELLETFPDARFNIDAKSQAAVALLVDHRRARRVRPGLRELVRNPPASTSCGAVSAGGSHRRRVRWALPPTGSCRGLRVC